MARPLEDQFHGAMVQIYEQAKAECDYVATRFIQMVAEKGGLRTAKELLSKDSPQEGFTRLWECGRLDLTVEALVLKPKFASLFNKAEREEARRRLEEYDYPLD